MISTGFKVTVVGLLVVLGAGAIVGLRLDNARLRQRIGTQQRENAEAGRLRDENRRTQELLTRSQGDATDGARAMQADIVRLRQEVTLMEKRAEESLRQKTVGESSDRVALATHRDPRLGLTPLEHFANVGQATPAAAWQTFAWAVHQRRADMLAAMCVMSEAGRARAEQLLGDMPEAERGRWTPEKLGLQFFNGILAQTKALEIVTESRQDTQNATLKLRLFGKEEATFTQPMQLGPQGWQVVITEQPIAAVQKRLRLIAEREAKK